MPTCMDSITIKLKSGLFQVVRDWITGIVHQIKRELWPFFCANNTISPSVFPPLNGIFVSMKHREMKCSETNVCCSAMTLHSE